MAATQAAQAHLAAFLGASILRGLSVEQFSMGAQLWCFGAWEHREAQYSGNGKPNSQSGSSGSPGGVIGHAGYNLLHVLIKVIQHLSTTQQQLMCKAVCLSSVPKQERDPREPPMADVHL